MKQKEGYFKDDELEALIAKVEADGILPAPVYLKERIIKSISVHKKRSANIILTLYSVKIAAAAAAALFLLIALPMGRQPQQNTGDKFTSLMNEKSNELCQTLNSFSNWLIMEDKEYE